MPLSTRKLATVGIQVDRRRRSRPCWSSMKAVELAGASAMSLLKRREQLGLALEQRAEGVAVSLMTSDLIAARDRGGAAAAVDQRHLADIGAGGEVGEEDRLAADILLDHHRALADDEDVVVVLALVDDRLAGLDALTISALASTSTRSSRGEARAEHLQQLPLGRDAGDLALRRRHGRHQLQRRVARDLDARSRPTRRGPWRRACGPKSGRPRRRSSPAPIGTVIAGLVGSTSTSTEPSAIANSDEPGSLRSKIDVAGPVGDRIGIEHELAHLQHRHLVEDRDPAAQEAEPFVDRCGCPAGRRTSARGSARRRASARYCR